MLTIASCMFPCIKWLCCCSSLLQLCLASVQSRMSTNKLKLHPDKTESLLIGNERKRSIYFSMFPIEILGVKTKISLPLTYIGCLKLMLLPCSAYVAHLPLLWSGYSKITCMQMLLCLDYYNSLLCVASRTLSSPNFNVYRIDWPVLWQIHLLLLAVFHCCIPSIGYQ